MKSMYFMTSFAVRNFWCEGSVDNFLGGKALFTNRNRTMWITVKSGFISERHRTIEVFPEPSSPEIEITIFLVFFFFFEVANISICILQTYK